MNKGQRKYREYELMDRFLHLWNLGSIPFFIYASTVLSSGTETFDKVGGVVTGLFGGIFALGGIMGAKKKIRLNSFVKSTERSDDQSLEDIQTIKITDEKGLEKLLKRTARDEILEWGTLLNINYDGEEATIYKILDSEKADELFERKRRSLRLLEKWSELAEEYQGHHHFHPTSWRCRYEASFHIHTGDRLSVYNKEGRNYLGLLTFNMPNGPEIIGFSLGNTYIPVDGTKKVLKRATPEDIMAYLA